MPKPPTFDILGFTHICGRSLFGESGICDGKAGDFPSRPGCHNCNDSLSSLVRLSANAFSFLSPESVTQILRSLRVM